MGKTKTNIPVLAKLPRGTSNISVAPIVSCFLPAGEGATGRVVITLRSPMRNIAMTYELATELWEQLEAAATQLGAPTQARRARA
jgi:hypothetical protein